MRFETIRVPSSRSTRITTRGASSGSVGWWETIQECTVPRPVDSWVSVASDPHRAHIGAGGWRRVPQSAQRWMRSFSSRAPSQKKASSALGIGGFTAISGRAPG